MVLGSYTDRQVVQYAADRAVIQTGERHHNLWRRGAFRSLRIYICILWYHLDPPFGLSPVPSCLWSALPATKTSMFILTSCLRLCKVYLYIQELLNHYTPRSTYWLFSSYSYIFYTDWSSNSCCAVPALVSLSRAPPWIHICQWIVQFHCWIVWSCLIFYTVQAILPNPGSVLQSILLHRLNYDFLEINWRLQYIFTYLLSIITF